MNPLGHRRGFSSANVERLEKENQRMAEGIEMLMALVAHQANDEGLWFMAQYASEGYFQQELRKIHAAVESLSPRNGGPK